MSTHRAGAVSPGHPVAAVDGNSGRMTAAGNDELRPRFITGEFTGWLGAPR